jgi:hypothetical protein
LAQHVALRRCPQLSTAPTAAASWLGRSRLRRPPGAKGSCLSSCPPERSAAVSGPSHIASAVVRRVTVGLRGLTGFVQHADPELRASRRQQSRSPRGTELRVSSSAPPERRVTSYLSSRISS